MSGLAEFSSLDDFNEATRRNEEHQRRLHDAQWADSVRKRKAAQKSAHKAAEHSEQLRQLREQEARDVEQAAEIFADQRDLRAKTRQSASQAHWLSAFHSTLDASAAALLDSIPDQLSALSIQSHLLTLSLQSDLHSDLHTE